MKLFLAGLFCLFFLSGCISSSSTTSPRVCFGERCVLVEIADSPEERSRGLMDRDSLPGNYGMLFVFDSENIHGFWMKNTLIPLDGIWINSRSEVVDVMTMFPCAKDPCPVYTPRSDAQYVVEVNAGVAKNWNIVPGTIVQIVGA